MNRSITQYLLEYEQEQRPGLLSRVGGHLKRNWGKYALGAGALAGGAMLANPMLASKAGQVVGQGFQSAGQAITPAANSTGLLSRAGQTVGQGLQSTGQGIQTAGNVAARGLSHARSAMVTGVRNAGNAITPATGSNPSVFNNIRRGIGTPMQNFGMNRNIY